MSMFANLRPRAPDAILGLMERYHADDRPHKISLAQGVFMDESGTTPLLETVREAEARMLAVPTSKVYKPIDGDPAYRRVVRDLIFGADHAIVTDRRVEVLHTPGGTGALRVAGDLIAAVRPGAAVWLPTPSWPNHPQVFAASRLELRSYPYLRPTDGQLDLEGMLSALAEASRGDIVVLHGCCHNPTGIDPSSGQWQAIADVIRTGGLLPIVDFAYQGFGDGLVEDAGGLMTLIDRVQEMLVTSSFSKNFSLYDERVGALSIIGADPTEAAALLSHAKAVIRANYSNPPAHGGEIVATVLSDPDLRTRWEDEVRMMRERINGNRARFVTGLTDAGAPGDHGPLLRQRGMFSLLGLSEEQVARLRDEFAIYVVGMGRVNIAGLTKDNLEPVCQALAAVTA
jgi:aspartate/tyrosine/aromatic aminotransferase